MAEGHDDGRYVGVVADDLIWASRLSASVERAGARPLPIGIPREQRALMAGPDYRGTVVDLNGRTYDPLEAIRYATMDGAPVIAVGQHEDLELRKAALAAGARRVFSYNKFFTDGPDLVRTWLIEPTTAGSR